MKKNTLKQNPLFCLFALFSTLFFIGCSNEDEILSLDSEGLSSENSSFISSDTPTTGKTYFIKSLHSEKYLDVADYSTINGGEIHQWEYTGAENQQWKVISNGSTFRIISIHSGKAMEVAGYSNSNGGQIQQWTYIGHNYQKFTFNGSSSEGYEMKIVGSSKLVDVADWSTTNGGTIHQWTDNNTDNQKWEFIEVNDDFINTNNGTFDIDDFQIESSSQLSSSTSTTTTTWDCNDDDILGTEWYYSSGGDYYLKSASYDGKRTEWKEKSGQEDDLDADKVMKYEAYVDNIPENGVTIAQVHNRYSGDDDKIQRPYIRVFIDDDGKLKVKETTNDLTNSSGTYNEEIGPEYSEGEKFKVQITIGDDKVNVKIEFDGETLDEDFTPYTGGNYDDYKNDFYLKAGVYTEGDDTEPVIRFYSFEKS